MTEEQKIFAGRLFSPQGQELRDTKHRTHLICQQYNALDEYDEETRTALLRSILGGMGEDVYIQGPVQFNYGKHTVIGSHFFANYNFTALDDNRITIGDYVMFAPNVSLMAASHPLLPDERSHLKNEAGEEYIAEVAEDIHIGNDVWLGCGVIVIGGVHIGNNVVVGAGSVVLHDIPDGVLACGNPCRVIRSITEKDSLRHLL